MTTRAENCKNRGLLTGRISMKNGSPLSGGYVYLNYINGSGEFLTIYNPAGACSMVTRTDEDGYFFLEFIWSGIQLGTALDSHFQLQVLDPGPAFSPHVAGKKTFTGKIQKFVSLGAISGLSGSTVGKNLVKGLVAAYEKYRSGSITKLPNNLLSRTPSPEYVTLIGVVVDDIGI